MKNQFAISRLPTLIGACIAGLTACGGGSVAPVTITVAGPNAVSYWNEVATNTVTAAATATGSAAEQRPDAFLDQAVVHLAIYDALMAITKTHKPYAITPAADAEGASQEAATAAAAYGVLKGMYPNRSSLYQAAYDTYVGGLAAGTATSKGLTLGAEVAQRMLALRGDDGRSVVLATYVPGTAPGQFRGTNPVARPTAFEKPLALTGAAQFRLPPPPALDSATYAQDYNEVRQIGGTVSATRTETQLDIARFHTEPPPRFWARNLRNFAMTNRSLADHARLMAILLTAQADASIACFDSKYFYQAWRPQSAIPLGDTDGNAATAADAAWTPVVPTPNHPEYPAAHGCVSGAVTEALKAFYQTDQVTFSFDSTVTNTAHKFATTQALVDEVQVARIYGGMHFRYSTVAGITLGTNVGQWVVANNFQAR